MSQGLCLSSQFPFGLRCTAYERSQTLTWNGWMRLHVDVYARCLLFRLVLSVTPSFYGARFQPLHRLNLLQLLT